MTVWLRSEIVASGPKIFRPTLDQCLALEQVAPRIATADYVQPYPVMLVEFPEAYRTRRSCHAETVQFSGTHGPEGVAVGFYPSPVALIWLETFFSSGKFVRIVVYPTDQSIEERILREFGSDSYAMLDVLTVEECVVVAGAVRVAVNAMLLLTEFGCKRLGPVNESHHRRLQRYRDLARRRGSGVEDAELNLRLAPELFGLAQEVTLHEEAEARSAPDMLGMGDAPRRPHWRRGHWKMHAHGPGRLERKRIFSKPVLVNRHLLAGDDGILQTIYRIR